MLLPGPRRSASRERLSSSSDDRLAAALLHRCALKRRGRWQIVASRDARDGCVKIHKDAEVHVAALGKDDAVRHALRPGRAAWLHVARGTVRVGDLTLRDGDGAGVAGVEGIAVAADGPDSEVVQFDLADA